MSVTITWSNQSERDFDENLAYLLKKWTIQDAINFRIKLDNCLNIIKEGNTTFACYDKNYFPSIFFVPITQHITLYYEVISETKIDILRLWNNYKDPIHFTPWCSFVASTYLLYCFKETVYYLPIQKREKIFPSKSSVVISPVISPK